MAGTCARVFNLADDPQLQRRDIAMKAKPTALVVEDDDFQRTMVTLLLEECEMNVIECDSAEAATVVLQEEGHDLAMIYADIHLGGGMNGIELADFAMQRFPDLHVVIASGDVNAKPPHGARFMLKPWRPLDLLREAERSQRY
jgi:CheY-like chemotaxis protein